MPNLTKKKPPVGIWEVTLSTDDWFNVFARSRNEAIRIVLHTHFPEFGWRGFMKEFKPSVKKATDDCKITVLEDASRGPQLRTRTVKQWAKGQQPGPFTSNTYEW